MAAKVEYKASVVKDLRRLGKERALRLVAKIEKTLGDSKTRGKAVPGGFEGLYSLRGGDSRVTYVRTVGGFLVLRIGPRDPAGKSRATKIE